MRRQWAVGILEAKVMPESIPGALKRCRMSNSPFIPSLGVFLSWCYESQMELLGHPTPKEAKREVLVWTCQSRKDQINPISYWCSRQRATTDWQTYTAKEFDLEFAQVWDEAVELAISGYKFDAPALEKPKEPERKPCDPAEAEKHVSNIRKMFD